MKQLMRIITIICIFSVASFAGTRRFENTNLSKQISTFTKQIKERSLFKIKKKALKPTECVAGDITDECDEVIGGYLVCFWDDGTSMYAEIFY
jgi:hypothetical protein